MPIKRLAAVVMLLAMLPLMQPVYAQTEPSAPAQSAPPQSEAAQPATPEPAAIPQSDPHLLVASSAAPGEKSSTYGKRLVAEYDFSADQIAAIRALQDSQKGRQSGGYIVKLPEKLGKSYSPTMAVKADAGPYTMVVTVGGKANMSGDATTVWEAGWTVEGVTHLLLMPAPTRPNAVADQEVSTTEASAPMSFKTNRDAELSLILLETRNIDLKSVHVQVWSGFGKTSWRDWFAHFGWAITGIVFLSVTIWMRRR